MLLPRIIPCLLLSNDGLVKTTGFKNPQYVGDPINAVKIFNDKEVDELILLDIDASIQQKSPNFELIADIASEAFMPIAYGGGIKNLEQAKRIIHSGVEKVIVNSIALDNLNIIYDLSTQFGASSIVVAVDVKANLFGIYKIFNPRTRKLEKRSLQEYITELEAAGAGEIVINDIAREGNYQGLNCNLVKEIVSLTQLPVIISGGAGKLEHFVAAYKEGVSGIAAGSMFIYMGKHRAVMINYPSPTSLKEVFSDVCV